MNLDRVGKFSVSEDIIFDNHRLAHKIFDGMIIIEARQNGYRGVFEYVAYHKDFHKIDFGVEPPWYTCCVNDDGTVTWVGE